MCGRRSWSIRVLIFLLPFTVTNVYAGTVDISCSAGVLDFDGSWLLGSALGGSGDLVQVIYAGANGLNDLPDINGDPTSDDVLIGVTFVGAGYPINPDEGKFAKQFTDDLLASGNVIYVRAWNGETVLDATHYGDSPLSTLALTGGFGAVNFPTWAAGEAWVAVELFNFQTTSVTGGLRISWITDSETENMGFHLHRSTAEDGIYERITDHMIEGAGNSNERRHYYYDDYEVAPDTTYYYKLADIDFAGNIRFHGPISGIAKTVPDRYFLEQNYPNPFNPTTSIVFDLKDSGPASLKIYNLHGQLVKTLVDKEMQAGRHKFMWDATNDEGNRVTTGLYLYILEAKEVKLSKTMVLLK